MGEVGLLSHFESGTASYNVHYRKLETLIFLSHVGSTEILRKTVSPMSLGPDLVISGAQLLSYHDTGVSASLEDFRLARPLA